MRQSRLTALVVALLMLGAAVAAHVLRPTQYMSDMRPKQTLEQLFPKRFGKWVVDDRMPVQLISPDQAAVLNAIYNETLSRTYVNPAGERVMLSDRREPIEYCEMKYVPSYRYKSRVRK